MTKYAACLTTLEGYDPNHMLNEVIHRMRLKYDADLSRALETAPPVISKVRRLNLPVGATLLIRLHEVSGISIAELRALMGDTRPKFS